MSVEAPPRSAERVSAVRARPLFDPPIVKRAALDSFGKLNPRTLLRNPVIFVVEVVSVVVTIRVVVDALRGGPVAFDSAIAFGLWFTVLFANFAEAMAEGRGKAQADTLRKTSGLPGGPAAHPGRRRGDGAGLGTQPGRRGHGQGRGTHPRRWRDRGGDRLGRRVGHHWGVGAGDPGVRGGPLRGDRRHEGCCRTGSRGRSPRSRGSPSSTG